MRARVRPHRVVSTAAAAGIVCLGLVQPATVSATPSNAVGTNLAAATVGAPAPPTAVSAVPGTNSARVSWAAPTPGPLAIQSYRAWAGRDVPSTSDPSAVPGAPRGMALVPDASLLLAALELSDQLAFIDPATGAVEGTVTVGDAPFDVAASPDGHRAYVANNGSATITVVDLDTRAVVKTVPLPGPPQRLKVRADGAALYVTDGQHGRLLVVDPDAGVVTGVAQVGGAPDGVAVSPDGQHLYISNAPTGGLTSVSTGTLAVQWSVPTFGTPTDLTLLGDTRAFLTDCPGYSVHVVDLTSHHLVRTITLPFGACPELPAAGLDAVLIPDFGLGNAYILKPDSPSFTTIPVGKGAVSAAFLPDGLTAYVAAQLDDAVVKVEIPGPTCIVPAAAATPTACVISPLMNGQPYTFRVTATNALGESEPSQPSAAVVPRRLPAIPVDVQAAPTDSGALVSWQEGMDVTASVSVGFRATAAPGGASCATTAPPGGAPPTSCVITGLSNGADYTVTVDSVAADGERSWGSNQAEVRPGRRPDPPEQVNAIGGYQSAQITWLPPGNDGGRPVTSYLVTTSPGGGSCVVSGTSATCQGLIPATNYSVQVRAVNELGQSDPTQPLPVFSTATPAEALRIGQPRSTAPRILFGQGVRISADVEGQWSDGVWRPAPGHLVLLQTNVTGRWTTVATGTVPASGTITLRAKPTRSQSYRIVVGDSISTVVGIHVIQPTARARFGRLSCDSRTVVVGKDATCRTRVQRLWDDGRWRPMTEGRVIVQALAARGWKDLTWYRSGLDSVVNFTVTIRSPQRLRLRFGSSLSQPVAIAVIPRRPERLDFSWGGCSPNFDLGVRILDNGDDYGRPRTLIRFQYRAGRQDPWILLRFAYAAGSSPARITYSFWTYGTGYYRVSAPVYGISSTGYFRPALPGECQ